MDFQLVSEFQPTGDQPQAIKELVNGLNSGTKFQTLLGVTDKPSFFICKNWFEAEVSKSYPNLEKIGSKNGFVFWKREK